MKNPINKNATISLDTEETAYFISREDAQKAATRMNLQNWTVDRITRNDVPGRKAYKLTWKKFK